jgi:diacylglycerol kinase family enzyme
MKPDGRLKFQRRPPDADHVLLLSNPLAGSGPTADRIDGLRRELHRHHLECTVITELSELWPAVTELKASGRLRTVVAAGGDGTAEVVANSTPDETPITVFPLGTENLLAKYLGVTADPTAMARIIQAGITVRLDAGLVCAGDAAPRLFLLMMGCGFDAEVIHRVHQSRAGHITHLAYAKPIVDAIRTYDYPQVNVTCHEYPGGPVLRTINAHWVFVFNTPSYASGLEIFPDANPFDGVLDLITFRGGTFWQGLIHLGNVLVGRHRQSRSVQTAQVKCARICSERPVPIQVDGDPGGALPVEVRVQPQRLTVLVPEQWTNRPLMR